MWATVIILAGFATFVAVSLLTQRSNGVRASGAIIQSVREQSQQALAAGNFNSTALESIMRTNPNIEVIAAYDGNNRLFYVQRGGTVQLNAHRDYRFINFRYGLFTTQLTGGGQTPQLDVIVSLINAQNALVLLRRALGLTGAFLVVTALLLFMNTLAIYFKNRKGLLAHEASGSDEPFELNDDEPAARSKTKVSKKAAEATAGPAFDSSLLDSSDDDFLTNFTATNQEDEPDFALMSEENPEDDFNNFSLDTELAGLPAIEGLDQPEEFNLPDFNEDELSDDNDNLSEPAAEETMASEADEEAFSLPALKDLELPEDDFNVDNLSEPEAEEAVNNVDDFNLPEIPEFEEELTADNLNEPETEDADSTELSLDEPLTLSEDLETINNLAPPDDLSEDLDDLANFLDNNEEANDLNNLIEEDMSALDDLSDLNDLDSYLPEATASPEEEAEARSFKNLEDSLAALANDNDRLSLLCLELNDGDELDFKDSLASFFEQGTIQMINAKLAAVALTINEEEALKQIAGYQGKYEAIKASYGVSSFTERKVSPHLLVREAREALAKAKASGTEGAVVAFKRDSERYDAIFND